MERRMLLISNSTMYGRRYFDHCADDLLSFLGEQRRVLFIPYAFQDLDSYSAKVSERFGELGISINPIHRFDERTAVAEAEAIFIGGGNTFRLLAKLYEKDLLEPIRRRVFSGVPYIGSSAGSGISAPTIRTSNDMPIVQPPAFDSLGLVPFQMNLHYIDPDPSSNHMGETRETRIREFHEVSDAPVLGLREGGWLRIGSESVELRGENRARLFRRGQAAEEFASGARLDFLLS